MLNNANACKGYQEDKCNTAALILNGETGTFIVSGGV